MPRLFPRLTATRLQATTYLLGIALFSISFLVFLNSTISFVVTDVIGQKHGVGDAVGTLGFADELLALVACPAWGLASDRIGVRTVAVLGYCIVGLSLVCLVMSENVYPELLVGRLVFSVGGAACSTMVTAVLPAMVAERSPAKREDDEEVGGGEGTGDLVPNGHAARLREEESREGRRGSVGPEGTGSVSSEVTITPTRYESRSRTPRESGEEAGEEGEEKAVEMRVAETSQLAGMVGLFTGAGALIALAVFLPLPSYFQGEGKSQAASVQASFYIVGAIAFCVSIFIFFGLRHLPGEQDKSFSALFNRPYDESTQMDHEGNLHITLTPAPSYFILVKDSLKLGFTDRSIGLGYLGGFVARASSVGISLFIPLFVNAYFRRTGLCTSDGDNLTDIKKNCQRAYQLAAALSGIAETAALLCAPLFGIVSGRVAKGRNEYPLLASSLLGVAGYVGFGMLRKPDPFHGDGGQWAIVAVVIIGIGQIGAIVCSLGLLGRGISSVDASPRPKRRPGASVDSAAPTNAAVSAAEAAPLLPRADNDDNDGDGDDNRKPKDFSKRDRSHLKGSIAGMYSFAGGAGILLLTKLGGALFDSWTPGAPFFILAIFNAVLAAAILLVGGGSFVLRATSFEREEGKVGRSGRGSGRGVRARAREHNE